MVDNGNKEEYVKYMQEVQNKFNEMMSIGEKYNIEPVEHVSLVLFLAVSSASQLADLLRKLGKGGSLNGKEKL